MKLEGGRESGRPDVLILLADQFNPYCMGCAGDPLIQTPNIDRLATEGVRFANACTVSPVCMPARCSMVSGWYPHNHGFWMNFTDLRFPPEHATMFRDLRKAGYRTAHVGKSHWFNPEWGVHYREFEDYFRAMGLDHCVEISEPHAVPFHPSVYTDHLREKGLLEAYLDSIAVDMERGGYLPFRSAAAPEDYNDALVGRYAVEFIETCPREQPCCLHVGFAGPHSPMDAPGEYSTMYAPDDIELPGNVPKCARVHNRACSRDEIRRIRANYYGKITLIDHWIGRIIESLERRGTWDRTIVVFVADHGEYIGAHGRLGKCGFETESAGVPLIVRWPEHVPGGRTTQALASNLDVFPTVFDAVGAEMSPERFGKSLLPVARGETSAVQDAVFSEIGHGARQSYMVRTADFKWSSLGGGERLFNLREDPLESRDLAASPAHAPVMTEMRRRLRQFLMETQVNYARGYRCLFDRAGIATGGGRVGDKLRTLFRELDRRATNGDDGRRP
jgi:arylsulfatase A-like enzyme